MNHQNSGTEHRYEDLSLKNQKIAQETLEILHKGSYRVDGRKVDLHLATGIYDFEKVQVYNSTRLADLVNDMDGFMHEHFYEPDTHKILIQSADSLEAAKEYYRPLVLNFANAFTPGGGFLSGASSQEESLCRASSLYVSINSMAAKEMYQYNLDHRNPFDSDFMLLSEQVAVFRNIKNELLKHPFPISVLTVPAIDRSRPDSFNYSQQEADVVMKNRIRLLLLVAARNMYRNLILGAWGCGVFGNDASTVAGYFYQILIEEHFEDYFETVVFAIYEREGRKNIDAFCNVFHINDSSQQSNALSRSETVSDTQLSASEAVRKGIPAKTPLIRLETYEQPSSFDKPNEIKMPEKRPFIEFTRNFVKVEPTDKDSSPKRYIQSAYPMPVLSTQGYMEDMLNSVGQAQGIFQDGIPFVAELVNLNQENSAAATFFLPYVMKLPYQERIMNREHKMSSYEIEINHLHQYSAFTRCLRDCPVSIGYQDTDRYINYLIGMGVLLQKTESLYGSAKIMADPLGRNVLVLELLVIRKGRVDAVVTLGFKAGIL